jgi:histidyl-tRNA synthetase
MQKEEKRSVKFSAPKGTRDILPEEAFEWQYIEDLFRQICHVYSYGEIRIPTFENTDIFTRGVGKTTDIVQKEMYTFNDKGKRSITLRPEGTAGVARAYIENGMDSSPSPVRLYYIINAFRYENVQKGRYREFHQLGLEAFGSLGPQTDAEIISLLILFLSKLGIDSLRVKINSIGCPNCRAKYNKILKEMLAERRLTMCALCRERIDKNPLRVLDCKEPQCKAVIVSVPVLLDHLCEECQIHFNGLQKNLQLLDISYDVDPTIVRGLDYYTKTVFEFISEHVGTQGTICGGGRYDGLIEELEGKPTPGIGFALGMERLLMELHARGIELPKRLKSSIYLLYADLHGEEISRKICYNLRKNGMKADIDLMNRSLRSQMKYAGKCGYTYLCVIGESEIEKGVVLFKHTSDKTEVAVKIQSLDQLHYNGGGEIVWPKP